MADDKSSGNSTEPGASQTKAGQPRQIALALLIIWLFISSVDRLIDAWQAGQTWRAALFAVVSLAVIVTGVYYVVRGRGA